MAIETAANLRGLLRAGLVIALGMFSLSGAANGAEGTGLDRLRHSAASERVRILPGLQDHQRAQRRHGDAGCLRRRRVWLSLSVEAGIDDLPDVIAAHDRLLGHVLERGHDDGRQGDALYYGPLQRKPAHLSRSLRLVEGHLEFLCERKQLVSAACRRLRGRGHFGHRIPRQPGQGRQRSAVRLRRDGRTRW